MNDFEEFAMQFRRRTVARLLEFEKNLEKAQRDVEKAVTRAPAPPPGSQRHAGARKNRQVKGVLRCD